MKYDFDLDLTNSNSLLLILQQIKRNSVILEFGPANGRMTKYLKQELNCDVYLAELDEEAGREALVYGKDLVVGDIENFEWLQRYKDIKFDYIIFADVLEHLRDPRTVLDRCKLLLKHEGSVLLSVPNLAHNSVLIDLMNNKFEYTQVGLLDNTHIHFFTKSSLENMIMQSGYHPIKRMATYSKVGTNELINSIEDVADIDKSYWDTREYGEVYQFVYELKAFKEQAVNEENYIRKTLGNYYAEAFLGKDGYTPDNKIRTEIENIRGISRLVFKSEQLFNEFRIDPVNTSAILKVHSMVGFDKDNNQIEVQIKEHNAIKTGNNIYIFYTQDPIFIITTQNDVNIVRVEIVLEYISIDAKNIEKISEATMRATMVNENNEELSVLREYRDNLENRYIEQLQQKDAIISDLQRQLEDLQRHTDNIIKIKDDEITAMRNSKSWKMTKIFRRS